MRSVKSSSVHCALILVLVFGLLSSAYSHDPANETKDPEAWDISFLLGFNLTDGNSDTTLLNFGAKAEQEKQGSIWRFGADHSFGEEDSTTNVDSTDALLEYKYLMSDRFYIGLGTDYRRDEISDVKYRLSANPVIGYFFLKTDSSRFNIEVGPSYVFEEVAGISDDYFAPRVAERLEYNISETAKFFKEVAVTFDINESDNYIIKAEAGLEATIAASLSLVISIQDVYDNLPAEARERNDLQFITSLAYKL